MPKTLTQKVVFRNTNATTLYSMYLDSKHHSGITNGKPAKIAPKEGASYSANGGGHSGRILQLVPDRLIVQSFVATDWTKKDIDSTLTLLFEQKGKDAVLHMTHANVPDKRTKEITKGWKDFYWTPWKKYLASMK